MTLEKKVDFIFEVLVINGMILNEKAVRNRIFPIEERLEAFGRLFQGAMGRFSSADLKIANGGSDEKPTL